MNGRFKLGFNALICLGFFAVDAGAAEPTAAGLTFFEKKIRPVLVERCYKCHSAKSEKLKGGLLLDTRAGIRKGGESGHAVVPGDVRGSLLIEAIRYGAEEPAVELAVLQKQNRVLVPMAAGPPEGRRDAVDAFAAVDAAVQAKHVNFPAELFGHEPPRLAPVQSPAHGIVQALDAVGLGFGPAQGWQQKGGENGNDGNRDQQLNQRKTTVFP